MHPVTLPHYPRRNNALGAGSGKIHFVYSTNAAQGDFLRTLDSNGMPSASWPAPMQFFGRDPSVAVGPNGSVAVYDSAYSLSYFNSAGTMLWQTRQSPVVSPGTGAVLFGADGTVYASNGAGLHALNPATGATRWRQMTARGSPLIDASNNLITYCGINPPLVLCATNANGQIVWQETSGYTYSGTPVIDASGAILAYTTNDRFVAFNNNGTVRWQIPLTPTTGVKSTNYPIVLSDGTIYVSATPQNLLIIGGGRGLASSPWPAPSRDYKNSRNSAGIVDIIANARPVAVPNSRPTQMLARNPGVSLEGAKVPSSSFDQRFLDEILGAVHTQLLVASPPKPRPSPSRDPLRIAMLAPPMPDHRLRSAGSAP